jgi:HEXXH motif-containing protein
MPSTTHDTDCFACPLERPEQREALLPRLWRARAQAATSGLADEVEREIAAKSSGLLESCRALPPSQLHDAALKGFPVGLLERASATGAADPVHAAAQAAAHLHLYGASGQWSARLRRPARLAFGRWTSRAGRVHSVSANGRAIEVESERDGQRSRFSLTRTGSTWLPEGDFSELATARLWGDALPVYLAADLELLATGESLDAVDEDAAAMVEQLELAARLVSEHAPSYAVWIHAITAGVIPLRGSMTSTQSSTHSHRFSILAASMGCRPVQIAEAFVHESSHEYFQMADRLQQLEDGSDPLLYYSPLRRTGRPVRSVYLAFHAMANMVLFFRACLNNGYQDDGYCAWYARHYAEAARGMVADLVRSPGVTANGRHLAEQLALRLGVPSASACAREGSVSHVG